MAFNAEVRAKAEELVGRYPVGRSALLPLLHLVQHVDGHISDDGVAECAELLGLTKAEVGAVATFYTMYKREPMGEHLVSVCTNFSCKVRGGQEVYDRLSAKLGVGHNGTTADGKFTLEHAECLGNCEGAPVVTVDYLNYEAVDADAAEELVDRIAAGEIPPPTRGVLPPGIREIQHRLSGAGPLHPAEPGSELGIARAEDAGVPVDDVGPGVEPVGVEPEFSPGRAGEREEARDAVRSAGKDPDDLQAQGGAQSREFQSRDPDWEPDRDEPTVKEPQVERSGDTTVSDEAHDRTMGPKTTETPSPDPEGP